MENTYCCSGRWAAHLIGSLVTSTPAKMDELEINTTTLADLNRHGTRDDISGGEILARRWAHNTP